MENITQQFLASDDRVFMVAEIGKGFIQSSDDRSVAEYLENSKSLIRAAHEAGADAVKFQTHTIEDEQLKIPVTSPHFAGADRYAWVKRNTEATPDEFWQELAAYARELGILMFSTPMSRGAAQKLQRLIDPLLWKVGSGDILDFVMLDYLAETGKPIIVSSGMTTPDELDSAMAFLAQRNADVVLLHCVSKYPCPPEELYLDTIPHLAERYKVPIGFSDHSLGHDAVLAAIARGARVIEKHFSLDRGLWGSDHKVSMLPDEFRGMVSKAKNVDIPAADSFGTGVKILDDKESAFRGIFRKSLVAGQDIPAGTALTKEMLYAMRPQSLAGGIPSERYADVLDKKSARNIARYEPITFEALM